MPTYNEEDNILKVIENVRTVMENEGYEYEIIVVDDGSQDRTLEKASDTTFHTNIKTIGYKTNMGKGYAIKFGLDHARGDTVIFMDSDLEIHPGRLREFVEAVKDYDIAIASKRHSMSQVKSPIMRILLSKSFHILVKLLVGIKVSDTQSGLKSGKKTALQQIAPLLSVKKYAMDVEILTVAQLLNLRIAELPVSLKLGGGFSFGSIIRMLVDLLGIAYRLRLKRWYQTNLGKPKIKYKPLIKW